MSEQVPSMEFDPEAMSARLEKLTAELCHLDIQVRRMMEDPAQDPMALAMIQGQVSTLIFNLPLVAVPTVVMFMASQLNMARNVAVSAFETGDEIADAIVEVATFLAAQDADAESLMTLLDLAKNLKAVDNPFIPCDDHEEQL